VFAFDASTALVVGDAVDGSTHAYRLGATAASELPFATRRSHARAIVATSGAVLVVGGARTMESFFP
jgi:hypothetical protein